MPNTYARGILFGKMILELGDVSSIRNEELDYHCDVDFRTKVSTHLLLVADDRAGYLEDTMQFTERSRVPTTTTSVIFRVIGTM